MFKIGFSLSLIYLLHLFASIFASILLLIVVLMLQRFDVFHKHLRTLLSHFLSCILLNNCLQILRLIPVFGHIFFGTADSIAEEEAGEEIAADTLSSSSSSTCPQFSVLPAPFCAFICLVGVLICMERLYATFNFAKYENENFQFLFARLFKILWALFALFSFLEFLFDLLPAFLLHISSSFYFDCQLKNIGINPLKTQWHLLFSLLFFCVFFLVLYVVLTLNKEKQQVYVKFHYSSLSHRFQIAENVKCARLLLKLVPQLAFGVALILANSVWLHSKSNNNSLGQGTGGGANDAFNLGEILKKNNNSENGGMGKEEKQIGDEEEERRRMLLIWSELCLFVMPILTSTIAYTIIRSSNVFLSKAKLVAVQLWAQMLLQAVWWRRRDEKEKGGTVIINVNKTTGEKEECPNCGTTHTNGEKKALCEARLLREYWDDYLHIQ